MGDFWSGNIDHESKLPLLLCIVAFVCTFVITRIIVRMIRSGRGPFSDNSVGGVHIHHVVPGIILMIVGGLLAIGGVGSGWDNAAGLIFGIGLALVLDEFALILHLEDVYWEEEGRLSVDAVFVLAGVMLLLLIVNSPFGINVNREQTTLRIFLLFVIALDLTMAAICAAKGKLGTALAGIAVPFIAYVGAIRVARPHSPWAKRSYGNHPDRLEKSEKREVQFDARWRSRVARFQDFVAGTFVGKE